jgi:hypothetical protein
LVDLSFGVQLFGRFRFCQPIAPVIHTWDMEQLVFRGGENALKLPKRSPKGWDFQKKATLLGSLVLMLCRAPLISFPIASGQHVFCTTTKKIKQLTRHQPDFTRPTVDRFKTVYVTDNFCSRPHGN